MAQDRRIEDVIREGGDALVDAVAGVLPDEVRPIFDLYRGSTKGALISVALDILRAAGIDTTAHVTAPAVDVHLHDGAKPNP
jgi:hypothetical protein